MAATVQTTATPTNTQPGSAQPVSPALAKLEKYWKPLTYALGALVILAAGLWLYRESSQRKAQMASDALEGAQGAYESGNLPAASTEFQRIIQSYAGTDAAYQAHLGLNTVRLASGQAQLAVDELKKFNDSDPPAYYASAAWLLSAGALENLKKFDEAAAAYLKAADAAEEDYRQVDARLGAARSYRQAGKSSEALEVLRGIVSKYGKEVAGVPEAQVRLAEMTRGAM